METPDKMATKKSFLESSTAKFFVVGFLTLLMLIPLQFVKHLIEERKDRQHEVINEIGQTWGSAVEVTGPILKVPYKKLNETIEITADNKRVKNQQWEQEYAYFLPEELLIDANVDCTDKKRNNYETTVFRNDMKMKGFFKKPEFKDVAPELIDWHKASLVIRTSNLKGMIGGEKINFAGNNLSFESTFIGNNRATKQVLETPVFNVSEMDDRMTFDYQVVFKGSQSISMIPIGKKSVFEMKSAWKHPNFKGYFSRVNDDEPTDQGFVAKWHINQLNRPFPQAFYGDFPELSAFNCETQFMIQVDEYQQNERASKYGFLVIGLTFLVFFLIQMMSKINIHFFQYTMIGIALVLFYTLLISITEHSSFSLAYIMAALAVIIMISLYSVSILKSKVFPVFIGVSLTALYGFIFVIIQLENYALLVGSIGLFLILGAVMFFSRKIEW